MLKTETTVASKVQVQPLKADSRERIGIMGGTFNPPHLGHLIIAKQVQEQLDLDKVLFMPDNLPPHIDQKAAIAAKYRLHMVEMSITSEPKFQLEDIEIRRGGVSYTYDTVQELKQLYPDADLYFIIGGDMVEYLPKWYKVDELVKMIQFVSVERKGYAKKSDYPLIWVDVPRIDISSSMIRERLQQGRSIKYLVTSEVENYIRQEGLYHDTNS
ncbi:nicotinate-nucleotide adenylyltransferase [Ligilactobacillus animalis]|uniref:nicotinate-nucleotide adenylyltransferase n=1 Tax=Ligilactobacillus animalis TaxID=1605 RepID=UPI0002194060|nr:nicotinate-nucleotide adenylyltransferase [Ligilactobacillus animalis]KRM57751.1 nicotinate-nucleotide adenylyltransferase [Ligilactobacillus animalis KCTC 3501 = DSM 20602]